MSDESRNDGTPGLRKTGNIRRPVVQETADPAGRKPVAQWVVSGSIVRPAHEVLPDPASSQLPAPTARPVWWMLAAAAAVGFALAIPVTWYAFTLLR